LPKVAGRLSFSGTTRGGFIDNTVANIDLNGLNNLGLRGQLLFAPSDRMAVIVAADTTRQRPDGHAQVVAGVAPTLRPASRQYPQIAADLDYTPPSFNAFDRLTDTDTPWRSYQDLGGASVTLDRRIGAGGLTSITGWRYWKWRPSNDRDFIGLPVTTISAAPSDQQQWSQEVRYAGSLTPSMNLVVGGFGFYQTLEPAPYHTQEQGSAAARFLLAPTPAAATPGLLDGYGQHIQFGFDTLSAALFGQLEWAVNDRVRVLPGLRVNYDRKDLDYDQQVYGGLQTTDPVLIALQRSVLSPLTYQANVDDTNVSGKVTAAYRINAQVNAYGTVATGFKSVGLNLGGVPTDALGRPITSAAVVKPEDVRHFEAGIKTEPFSGVMANLTFFNTGIKDYQTQVVNDQVGVLRGYLANAEKVRVRGVEFDGSARVTNRLSFYGAVAYTDGRYISFPDAPPPLEETGGPQGKDISGSVLPGISKWALSLGGEYVNPAHLLGQDGEVFGAFDTSYRSEFSSSPSVSEYLMIEGYPLVNLRTGFRWAGGWMLSFWTRNVLDHDYFELLSAQPGNSGLYVGLPGEPRTAGVTLRLGF
jgi:iron complex outermembrane receptor protein